MPTLARSASASATASGWRRFCPARRGPPLLPVHRRLDDVLQHRHVGPEIEALEHHRDLHADAVDLAAVGRPHAAAAVLLERDRLAAAPDPPPLRPPHTGGA